MSQITPTKPAAQRKIEVQNRELPEYDLNQERRDLESMWGTKPLDLDQLSNPEVMNYLNDLNKKLVDFPGISTSSKLPSSYSQYFQPKQQSAFPGSLPANPIATVGQGVQTAGYQSSSIGTQAHANPIPQEPQADPSFPLRGKSTSEGYLGYPFDEYSKLFPLSVAPGFDLAQAHAHKHSGPKVSPEMIRQMEQFSAKLCRLDLCPLCHSPYDLNERLPKIVPFCGHTICLTCLDDFMVDSIDLRCPKCFKVTKRVMHLDILPTNHVIFAKLTTGMNKEQQINASNILVLPGQVDLGKDGEMDEDQGQHWDELYGYCSIHEERIRHFYCEQHKVLVCRPCFEKLHGEGDCQVVDMYNVKDEQQIKAILAITSPNLS